MNNTIGFPRRVSSQWTPKQRLGAALGGLVLVGACLVASMSLVALSGGQGSSPAVAPSASIESRPEASQAFYLVSSQDEAEQLATWLIHDDPLRPLPGFVVAPTATEEAALYKIARVIELYDGVSVRIEDLR